MIIDSVAGKNTAPAQGRRPTHHPLEDLLKRHSVRRILGAITRIDRTGSCLFERVCENYNVEHHSAASRLRWGVSEFLIDYALNRAKLDKQLLTEKLFHHRPTVRALAMAGRSIARYGLSAPQRFAGPSMVVWNITQA